MRAKWCLVSSSTETLLERAGATGDDFMVEGSDALLDRLDGVMTDEFDAKMLGRVGRGYLAEVKFLKRTLRWHEQERCCSWNWEHTLRHGVVVDVFFLCRPYVTRYSGH